MSFTVPLWQLKELEKGFSGRQVHTKGVTHSKRKALFLILLCSAIVLLWKNCDNFSILLPELLQLHHITHGMG